jgi:hypothetical protein
VLRDEIEEAYCIEHMYLCQGEEVPSLKELPQEAKHKGSSKE